MRNPFKKSTTYRVEAPTKHDINNLRLRARACDKDDMIDIKDWDGGCFRSLFHDVAAVYAKELDVDPWDYFAVLIHKIYK